MTDLFRLLPNAPEQGRDAAQYRTYEEAQGFGPQTGIYVGG